MANSLASLTVSLGLNSAEYTSGLSKAELQAKRFAQNVNAAILQVGKVLGGLELGKQFLEATTEIISSAAALNALSASTGSSVESLSKLSNQAQIAGTSFETMQRMLLKLSSGMGGAGENSKEVARALKALGVTATDPAQALQDVAVALSKYADGTGKAAIAQALFQKEGPAFLATLQSIADLQDVSATTTKKQAEEAEKLEQQWRRLSVEATTFKNIILNDLVPALLVMLEDFRVGIQLAGGLFSAIALFGTLSPFDTPRQGINKMQDELTDLKQALLDQGPNWPFADGMKVRIDELTKKIDFLKMKERQLGNSLIDPSNADQNDRKLKGRPELDFKAATPGLGKKILTGQLKELDDFIRSEQETLQEREKFLQSYYQDDQIGLRQYFAARRDALEDATTKQAAALDKEAAAIKAFAATAKPGERIDAETKLADVIARRAKLQQEAAAKGIQLWLDEDKAIRAVKDSIELANIALAEMQGDTVTAAAAKFDFSTRKFAAQLKALAASPNPDDQSMAAIGQRDLEATRRQIVLQAQLNKATSEYSMTLDELGIVQHRIQNDQDTGAISATEAFNNRQAVAAAYIEKLKEELAVLEKIAAESGKREDIIKAAKARLELEDVAVAKLKESMKAMQDFQNMLSESFANSFEDFIMGTKSASQAFKDFANTVERYLLKIALQKVGDQLFGGNTSSGNDIFSAIFKMFSSYSGSGLQNVGGFQGFGTFAAQGTNFAFGGPTLVGEKGPEVVDMPRGARVWPNGTGPQGQAQAVHVENHFHVTGTVNAATVRQIERGVGDSVARNRIDR
jgi:hypothetical protein